MKKNGFREDLASILEMPGDLAYGEPVVTITGKKAALIENYRSILRYTRNEIVILTFRGKVTVCGKCLQIPCYTPWEMKITGWISRITLDWQEGQKDHG